MTEFIARVAGPYLFVTGLAFLVSNDFYRRMISGQPNADPILVNLSGAAHFVVGVTLLSSHFRWSTASEITVTLVGIAAALKGTSLILFPERTIRAPQMESMGVYLTSIPFISIGAYLVFVGFL